MDERELIEAEAFAVVTVSTAATLVHARAGGRAAVAKESNHSLVTETDLASEKLIVSVIEARYPEHMILSEEAGALAAAKSRYRWIIDPVDGTTNFASGYPAYAVSLSLIDGEEPVAAAIALPASGEVFSARRGGGTRCNGEPVIVTRTRTLSDSLLVASFPGIGPGNVDAEMERFGWLYRLSRGVRHDCSAQYDLCQLAAGRIDGFWESVLPLWDMAAGVLLVREAGGAVSDVDGSPWHPGATGLVASNGLIQAELVSALDFDPVRR